MFKKIFLLIFPIFSLLSCTEHEQTAEEYLKEHKCIYQKSKYTVDNAFPFNEADQVELVAYDSTNGTDFYDGKEKNHLSDSLKTGVRQRVMLNKAQIAALFSILNDYKYPNDSTIPELPVSYTPRHAVLFYKKDKLIEYLELCFDCKEIQYVNSISQFGVMCDDKWIYLESYFRKNGITKNYRH